MSLVIRVLRFSCLLLALLCPMRLVSLDAYEVQFEGHLSLDMLSTLKSASQLVQRQNSPPSTEAGLRHRAEADVEKLLQVLHSQAFYNGIIDFDYRFDLQPPFVVVKIDTGPVYPFKGFEIVPSSDDDKTLLLYKSISLECLGITLGAPALPEKILNAEEALLEKLESEGYPLAMILKKDVIADQSVQGIFVKLYVDAGPEAFFGPTEIIGNCTVKEEFFINKLYWHPGKKYNPSKVERTQNAIEASGLFSSIGITHAETVDENGYLPMKIEVIEGKHRSIGAGLAYATQRGPGLTAEWEHRNIGGVGEKIRMDTELWYDDQEVHLLYLKPDFLRRQQDFLWLAELRHESTKGYKESSFSLSGMIERQVRENMRTSYGLMYKWLRDTRSDVNGEYNLIKTPFQLRWSNVNSLLDPTKGYTMNLKVIPTVQFLSPQFAYCINTLTLTAYYPVTEDEQYVIASKMMFGSIWGSSRRTIPSSERFYEGSENTLRGYRYQTVSPLRECDKPIGGRSMMIYSTEFRVRATENFGWVAFYDFGNVYASIIPEINHKILQSVGFGIRYHTPVGPFRLDIAVPLNRRPKLDHRFQVYLSIGQAY